MPRVEPRARDVPRNSNGPRPRDGISEFAKLVKNRLEETVQDRRSRGVSRYRGLKAVVADSPVNFGPVHRCGFLRSAALSFPNGVSPSPNPLLSA
ncbi:hypothetical protein KM043_001304 [Ampulex compressa]|nr:hypothetical protein KM043_001304 [Ampulex compressa]